VSDYKSIIILGLTKDNLVDCNRLSVSDVVYTGGESLQDWLRDVQTCRVTLASAYVLCYLSAMWLQLQIGGKVQGRSEY